MTYNSQILIAGSGGNIGWINPTTLNYTPLNFPDSYTIEAVAYVSDNDIWAGVYTGWYEPVYIYHYNGINWTLHDLGRRAGYYTSVNDFLVYGPNDVWVLTSISGSAGWNDIFHWDGISWSRTLMSVYTKQGFFAGSGKSGGCGSGENLELNTGHESSSLNQFHRFDRTTNSWSGGSVSGIGAAKQSTGFAKNSFGQTFWMPFTWQNKIILKNTTDILTGEWTTVIEKTNTTRRTLWVNPNVSDDIWYTVSDLGYTSKVFHWDGTLDTEVVSGPYAWYWHILPTKDNDNNDIFFTAPSSENLGWYRVRRHSSNGTIEATSDDLFKINILRFPQPPLLFTIKQAEIEETAIEITDQVTTETVFIESANLCYRHEWNQFDEFGSLVGLQRLKGEKNWEYKRRILDIFTHLANSSYQGLMHGITRELNLSLFNAIEINPVVDINTGAFLATDPYIVFDNAYLSLYSDYQNSTLESQINRYQPGGNFEHLNDLIAAINLTGNFEASLSSEANLFTRSMTILNQSNRQFVTREKIPVSDKFQLKNRYLSKGTVFFSNRDVFRTEKTTVEEVILPGHYHIDYTTGVVTAYCISPDGIFVRYQYTQYPFVAIASPIILADINKNSFKVQMFERILQNNGLYVNGVATELGADIINELYSIVPMYWGK